MIRLLIIWLTCGVTAHYETQQNCHFCNGNTDITYCFAMINILQDDLLGTLEWWESWPCLQQSPWQCWLPHTPFPSLCPESSAPSSTCHGVMLLDHLIATLGEFIRILSPLVRQLTDEPFPSPLLTDSFCSTPRIYMKRCQTPTLLKVTERPSKPR